MATILLVEDQEDIRETMRLWLEMNDHEVHEAENGKVGVEMALKLQPNLILMDMHMPIMGGCEATQSMRNQHGYNGKIVAVTASVMKRDTKIVQESGCNGFIPKPIGMDFGDLVEGFLNGD